MSAKKIRRHISPVVYSVGRFRFLYYKDRKLSYGHLKDLGVTTLDIAELRSEMGYFESPPGCYGGNIEDDHKSKTIDFMCRLLKKRIKGFNPDDLTTKIRYHVMEDDRITVDVPPAPGSGGNRDYTKNKGYKSRESAEVAAEAFFKYYSNFCRDGSNKPTQPIKLLLLDEHGNVKKKASNGYK